MATPFGLKFGSDPEIFVRNKKTGKLVSVHEMLPGTKAQPHKVNGGAIQVDGVAAEINIDPVDNIDDWLVNHQKVLGELSYYLGTSHEMVFEPVGWFDNDYWEKLPDEPKELGCTPDMNAWLEQFNPPPNGQAQFAREGCVMRSASGHIHIGWTKGANIESEDHRRRCFDMVKQLDVSLGLRTRGWDSDTHRMKLYGAAGACRIKPYGVEYRVPSNKWLGDEQLMKRAFLFARSAAVKYFIGQTVKDTEQKLVLSTLR